MKKKSLTKDQILAAVATKKIKAVTVPDFGTVSIRVLTGEERAEYEENTFVDGKVDKKIMMASLVALTLCDENGTRLFSNADVASLNKLDFPTLNAIFFEAAKLNALTKADVDDLTKN